MSPRSEYKKPKCEQTPAQIASFERRVARTIRAGVTKKDACRIYGISDERLTGICQRHNVKLPTTGQRGAGVA